MAERAEVTLALLVFYMDFGAHCWVQENQGLQFAVHLSFRGANTNGNNDRQQSYNYQELFW